ncbi:hypothetical protein WK72_14645 [Burkholderia ubonensis]|uniref:hypothetical protein n=1 Tax=Burkholderia ubonensis TaxID=101571 RepID=UPI00075EC59D|nr:hypothetical protein [Burkholderia ubonensis]KVD61401.1 hypothetical protein WI88_13905 [Burkholderia ubonensis]KVU68959.1 hypothetical protein WK72_14645 [Burkholderia ubonensis]KWH15648.1 hypothetical protein WL97_16550 [Burkholderia ubonensis]
MGDFASAVVGASAVLVVGYASNILKEDYVRFLDGRALASALAGELAGHRTALPRLEKNLSEMILAKSIGSEVVFRSFATPTSPVFEASVGKLGLLGSPLAGEVAYLYEQIRAFRGAYALVIEHAKDMRDVELLTRLNFLKDLIVDGQPRADRTIDHLTAYADARFLPWLARMWGLNRAASIASGRNEAAPAINPTQGDDPSGSAR